MKPRLAALLICVMPAPIAVPGPVLAAPPRTAVVASYSLRVDAIDPASRALASFAESHGGYFATWTDDELVLRVPVGEVAALSERLAALGTVTDRRWDCDDVGAELAQLDAKLASRRAMLERYRAVLSTATPEAVVPIEKQMIDLIARIEAAQGERDVIAHRAAFARVSVTFRAIDTAPPPDVGASSFGWMNSLDLSRLTGSFRDDP